MLFGAGGVTRTHDLLITNQLLYRLSYTTTSSVTGWRSNQLNYLAINFQEILSNSSF